MSKTPFATKKEIAAYQRLRSLRAAAAATGQSHAWLRLKLFNSGIPILPQGGKQRYVHLTLDEYAAITRRNSNIVKQL